MEKAGVGEFVRLIQGLLSNCEGGGAYAVPAEAFNAWTAGAASSADELPLSFATGRTQKCTPEFEVLLRQRLQHPTTPVAWRAQFAAAEVFLREGLAPARPGSPPWSSMRHKTGWCPICAG